MVDLFFQTETTAKFNNCQNELQVARNQEEVKDSKIASQQQQISRLEKEATTLRNDVSTKDKHIEILKLQQNNKIAEKDEEIRRLNNRVEVTY